MNTRQRYIATVLFEQPDYIPFFPGRPRRSTLDAWHRQGLPQDAEWFSYLVSLLGFEQEWMHSEITPGVDFRMIPQFEEKVIEHRGDSLLVQDWKGNVCEISDQFDLECLRSPIDFVTRKWIKCPVERWEDWEQMKSRYDPSDPARFPSDFKQRCRILAEQDRVVSVFFNGPFMQLREWLGFENLCLAFIEKPDLVRDMLGFWRAFISRLLEKTLADLPLDYVHISEDMAYKGKSMISPAMVREFISPVWQEWADIVRGAGCPIYDVDSDGYVGELIPIWAEAGFQINDPVEVAAGNDLVALREAFGKQMAYLGGVDKRAIAKGGDAIKAETERLSPVVKSGGYIPSCDHGIPPDVSWPAMVEYSRRLAELTGWR